MLATFASIPKWLQITIALVCVAFILYVCIAPSIDLPDTTLRCLQMALLLLSLIALVASLEAAIAVELASFAVKRPARRVQRYAASAMLLLLCMHTC